MNPHDTHRVHQLETNKVWRAQWVHTLAIESCVDARASAADLIGVDALTFLGTVFFTLYLGLITGFGSAHALFSL